MLKESHSLLAVNNEQLRMEKEQAQAGFELEKKVRMQLVCPYAPSSSPLALLQLASRVLGRR